MINILKRKLFPSARARKIELLVLDVDGVLTDGKIILSSGGGESKNFSVYDGVAVNLGRKQGLKFAIITARKSEVTAARADELGIEDVFQVRGEKLPAYEALREKYGLCDSQIAYMGDDIHDVGIMKTVGLSVATANARAPALRSADYITRAEGGEGAVREVVDLILKSKGRILSLKQGVILLSAAALAGCLWWREEPAPPQPEEEKAGVEEKVEGGFRYTATEKGRIVMEIEGARASGLAFDSPEIFIEQPLVKWYGREDAVEAGGDEGVFFKGSNDVLFENNAWVQYGKTGNIAAESIRWESASSMFEAEGSVKGKFYFDKDFKGGADED